jgi:hypothetical protein
MTIEAWLEHAMADAERRGLAELKPLLEALARNTAALREADEQLHALDTAAGPPPPATGP